MQRSIEARGSPGLDLALKMTIELVNVTELEHIATVRTAQLVPFFAFKLSMKVTFPTIIAHLVAFISAVVWRVWEMLSSDCFAAYGAFFAAWLICLVALEFDSWCLDSFGR